MAWERRRRVEELKDNVTRLQVAVRKRRENRASLKSLLQAAPPSDDIESEDDMPYARGGDAAVSESSSGYIHYNPRTVSPRSPRGLPQTPFDTRRPPTSVLTLYTSSRSTANAVPSPRHHSPAREREYREATEARRLLFQTTDQARRDDGEETESEGTPVMSVRRERDEIISLAERVTQVSHHSGQPAMRANATTQVSAGGLCSCGRPHNHGHSSPHGPAVIEEYCVHATTTTKATVPRYQQPTWTSWPVASRRSPAEIDPTARVKSIRAVSPGRRSPSHSPLSLRRRPSPSPLRKSPMSRSIRSASASGMRDPGGPWDRLHYEGMHDRQARLQRAWEAQVERRQREEEEAAQYTHHPNFYRSRSRSVQRSAEQVAAELAAHSPSSDIDPEATQPVRSQSPRKRLDENPYDRLWERSVEHHRKRDEAAEQKVKRR